MTCYHPLRRFDVGINPDTGKSIGKVVGYNTKWISQDSKGNFYTHTTDYDPSFRSAYDFKVFTESTPIPCGRCIGCRLDQSKEWAVRMMLELPYHKEAWFLTLTYNDISLPSVENDQGDTVHPLVKRDVQLFIKRLRKAFPPGSVMFYAAGEYGFKNLRPHYHLILFLDEPLAYYGDFHVNRVVDGDIYYTNDFIDSIWYIEGRKGISAGFHLLTSVTFDTCQYVSNYCTKKVTGERAKQLEELGISPVFSLSSRKPAIGRRYFEEHCDELYTEYDMLLDAGGRPLRTRPPHYFDTLIDRDLTEYKAVRRNASEVRIAQILADTDRDYLTVLRDEEENFHKRATIRMKTKNNSI